MVKVIFIKSPDEWVTTKQAFRDELVAYLFFSFTIHPSLYFYVLSTVLRRSNLALYSIYIYIYIYIYILKSMKNETIPFLCFCVTRFTAIAALQA